MRVRILCSLVRFVAAAGFMCLATQGREVFLERDGETLRFGNGTVELVLDSHTGYFLSIENSLTHIHHKVGHDGAWPFGLTVGTREKPVVLTAEIRQDGVQQMTYKLENHEGGRKRLLVTYPMLRDNESKRETGVGLGVIIELAPDRDYFIVRAEIANGGGWWVTNFYAARGAVVTGDSSRNSETIYVPTRGAWKRDGLNARSLGLPTYGWGWSDYSGGTGGIGMAYVNKQGIQMMFDWKPDGDGLIQGWRLFNTRGYWHFENMMNDHQKSLLVQGLEPATNFVTDEWLIIPHQGDWHRTADVYRLRYLEVFRDDYINWDRLPERVKNLYLRVGFFIGENSIGNTYPRKVVTPLDSIAPQMKAVLKATGARPENVGVSATFFHPHVGRYPEWFPVYEAAGGERGWTQMVSSLHQMGLWISGYTHLSYDHPSAKNYVLEADALDTVPKTNPTAGNRACLDNSAWIRLWRDQLIPAYRAHGFDGVYADEGFFPWGMCAVVGPSHLHGTSAISILTANTRGSIRLHKLFHAGLGPGSVIMTEGAGDVSGRWVDMNHAYPDPAVAYTLPFKRYIWGLDALPPEPKLAENINISLAHGYAIMLNVSARPVGDLPEVRRYVETRRKMEASHAPGYPEGFRDTVGVRTTDPALIAKTFVSVSGITLIYYATAPVRGEVTVDAAALGHPKLGARKFPVTLAKDGIGFQLLEERLTGAR